MVGSTPLPDRPCLLNDNSLNLDLFFPPSAENAGQFGTWPRRICSGTGLSSAFKQMAKIIRDRSRAKVQQPPELFEARADLIRHCCDQPSIIAAAAPHRFAASSAAAKEGSVPVRYPAALGLILIVTHPRHKHTNPFRRGDPRRFTSPFRDRYRLPVHRPTAPTLQSACARYSISARCTGRR